MLSSSLLYIFEILHEKRILVLGYQVLYRGLPNSPSEITRGILSCIVLISCHISKQKFGPLLFCL